MSRKSATRHSFFEIELNRLPPALGEADARLRAAGGGPLVLNFLPGGRKSAARQTIARQRSSTRGVASATSTPRPATCSISTPRSSAASTASARASPALTKNAASVPASKSPTSASTTMRAWPTPKCCATRKRDHYRLPVARLDHFQALGIAATRIMTDNGSAYRSHLIGDLCRSRRMRHIFTVPIPRAPTARPSASSRPLCANGLTLGPTITSNNAPTLCCPGSIPTTITAPIAASAAALLSLLIT